MVGWSNKWANGALGLCQQYEGASLVVKMEIRLTLKLSLYWSSYFPTLT